MPRTEATRTINVPAEDAFALSMSQLEVRYAWDPFVSEQRLLNGATRPDRGVHSLTKSKHGLTMVSAPIPSSSPAPMPSFEALTGNARENDRRLMLHMATSAFAVSNV